MIDKISNHIQNPISGDWGNELSEDSDSFTFVLRTTNFTNVGKIKYTDVVKRDIEAKVLEKKLLKQNDIIIEKSGGSDNIPVGRVVFFDINKDNFICNNFTSIIRCKDTLRSKYLFYFLFRNHKLNVTAHYQNKTTGIRNLQLKRYLETQIPIPPLPQQEKIVKVLDLSSGLIEKQQELIKKYDFFLKSKFIEMFGDPISNPMGWEVVKLGNLTKVQTGKTPSRKNAEYWIDGTVNWAKTTEVNQTVITEVEEKITDLAVKECNMILFQKETILIAMYGQGKTRGKVVLLGTSTTINQAFGAILPSNNFETLYLLKLLDFMYENIRDLGRGGNQENLNLDIVRGINIILPPLTLQNKFAQIVAKIEQIKSQESQKLTQLQTLHASLMEKAFKGEIA
jgi:type I restriction enzyme S subunit